MKADTSKKCCQKINALNFRHCIMKTEKKATITANFIQSDRRALNLDINPSGPNELYGVR